MNKIILTTQQLSQSLPELLENDGCFQLCITGWSMRPLLLPEKDVVWLRAHSGTVHRGQILLFQRDNGHFVLHRVRKILPDQCILMNGDAQNWCEVIRHDQIRAEVYEINTRGKRLSCSGFPMKLYQILWYPTIKIRPYLFRMVSILKRGLSVFRAR